MTALTFIPPLTTACSGADVSERNLRGSRRRFKRIGPAVGTSTTAAVALFCLLCPAICAKGRPASPPMAVCNLVRRILGPLEGKKSKEVPPSGVSGFIYRGPVVEVAEGWSGGQK